MIRTVQYLDIFTPVVPPPGTVTPKTALSAFFDRGPQPPTAANQPAGGFPVEGAITSITPQGFVSFFDRGPQPATAANMDFAPRFTPQGKITSITPQGFVSFFDRGPQPATAARQLFSFFQPRGQITSITPQGFVSFFDRGPQPATAALQPFSFFTARGQIVSITPQGFVSFFDRGPQPPTAARQPFDSYRATIAFPPPRGSVAFFDRGFQPPTAARMPFPAEWKFIQSPFVPVIGVAGISAVGTLTAQIGATPLGALGRSAVGTVTVNIINAGGYSLYHGPERDQGPRPLVRKRVARKQELPPHAKPEGSVERPLQLPPFATAQDVMTIGPPRLPQMGRQPVDFSELAPRNPIQLGSKIKGAQDESEDLAAIRILISLGLL